MGIDRERDSILQFDVWNDILLDAFTAYIGITKQSDLWNECLLWLRARGKIDADGNFTGERSYTADQFCRGKMVLQSP